MLVADESGCGGVYAGMLGVLDVSELVDGEANTPPELLAGETLRIRITATDGEGREAADTRSVIAALDPADLPDTGG
jgi:hypothetical protein